MAFQLMRFQVHLRLKDHELLVQALLVEAEEVICLEVILQGTVVNVVLLLPIPRSSIADMAALVFVPTVSVEFIIPIEPLATETAFRVSSESTLVNRTGNIIAILLMPSQLCNGKEVMLMCKHFLVARTEITARPLVFTSKDYSKK